MSKNKLDSVVEPVEFKMKYDLKEILGWGTSSIVYRAVEKRSGEDYAVKIVDIAGEHGEAAAEQVKKETLKEIDILKLCFGHERIIQLFECFQTATNIFLIMELCKHGELFDYLTKMISLSERMVRILMRQTIQAVLYIHERNIVHRDLKLENILLVDEINIKLSDFGFSVILEGDEKLSDLCGTPSYLAPEVLNRSMYEDAPGYGKEIDMWACGVIMFTLLCGAPPFWHRRQMIMLRSIMSGDFSFNNPEWNDVSLDAKNLIQQLLIVNPEERLTAEDALEHPFFFSEDGVLFRKKQLYLDYDFKVLSRLFKMKPTNKFRVGVYCIIFVTRLLQCIKPTQVGLDLFRSDPYSIKVVRRVIDAAAFNMYRHWVQKESLQNSGALFGNNLPLSTINNYFLPSTPMTMSSQQLSLSE